MNTSIEVGVGSIDNSLPSRTWWTADKILSRKGVDGRKQVWREEDAILISSLTTNGLHAPCLDFDFASEKRVGKHGRTGLVLILSMLRLKEWNDTLKALYAAQLLSPFDFEQENSLLENEHVLGLQEHGIGLQVPFRVVPSSNPPHCHVYIDKEITWERYQPILIAMRELNILQRGFVNNSIDRKMTMLLKPGLKKEDLLARGIEIEDSSIEITSEEEV